ncbi:MAG: efflux RND transporter permease subunit [Deltaproteobacteria bacterium]|jgi:multidrug efflux pump subunit AcrB|nr:efflux RND transporter permease subunit [Deltaproteobacteria bacterium]
MKKIFSFFVNQPLFVNLLTILVLVAGTMSLTSLNRDVFPNIQLDLVMVTASYPGATPQEIEKLITIPIEKELKEVGDIKEMVSSSIEGRSMLSLEIEPDAPDKRKVVSDIQRAVDRADDLPSDMKDKPIVTEIETRNRPVVEVSLSSDMPLDELVEHARILETKILDMPHVAKATRSGWRDREVWVEVDPEKINDYYLSLPEVVAALREQNVSIPGGTVITGSKESIIRTTGEFDSASGVAPVVLRANDTGHWVQVKDIADVSDTFEQISIIQRANGTRAINLVVVKKERGDAIEVVNDVRKIVEEYKKAAPDNLEISLINDFSYYVKRRLNVLVNNGWIGIILVLMCLFLFLSSRIAIATALGIPMAFLTTFIVMSYSGLTINLITMFGLIMVLGMIVDDAIIISENVHRHIEGGMDPNDAAVKGAYEVWRPVIATVITTVAAFAPMMFMTGIMGKFIMYIPLIVIVALISSLVEAFIILPSHLVSLERLPKGKLFQKLHTGQFTRWFSRVANRYAMFLGWLIRRRWKVLSVVAVFFGVSFYIGLVHIPFVLFPQKGIESFFIRVKAPVGTPVEVTEKMMQSLEEAVASVPKSEWDDYVTQVGISQQDDIDPFSERSSHVGQIIVFLKPSSQRSMTADEIIESLREKTKDVKGFKELTFSKVRHGPPVGEPIVVRIRGDKYEELNIVAEKIKGYLAAIAGVSDVRDSYEVGKDEVRVVVDEMAASRAGLSVEDIALSVRAAFEGAIATTIKKSDEEIDVRVRYPDIYRYKEGALKEVMIPNGKGNLIPITQVAKFESAPGINAIHHYDRKRTIVVTAMVDEKEATSMGVTENVQGYFKEIEKSYPGVMLNYGGEWERTQESLASLKIAMVAAVLVIFIVLAFQFQSLMQPLIVMIAVPYGFVGIAWAFLFHMEPKSFLAMVGAVGLAGVVVNNSIVLIDFINKELAGGKQLRDAIIEAARIRLRPILLTTITTVVGLLPVAYGLMGSDPFLEPMALAIGWGLLFATFCTLLITPCVYAGIDDVRHWLGRKFQPQGANK